MRVSSVEVLTVEDEVVLPEEWRPAWTQPDGPPVRSWRFAFYRVLTDEGIEGIGPYTGELPEEVLSFVRGFDPFKVHEFWETYLSGRRWGSDIVEAVGIEVALWDIVGKALRVPVYRLLGGYKDRIPVYAATSRLLPPEELARLVVGLADMGFRAVKIRFHRQNPDDDLRAARAVKDHLGDSILLLVDANQNNPSRAYNFWSRRTALRVARELDRMGFYLLEDPLPLNDVDGLVELAKAVDMYIGGGEHGRTVYSLREHIVRGAYDVVQQDLMLGSIGIIGLRRLALVADYFGRLLIPHVCSAMRFPYSFVPTVHAAASLANVPMVEYPFDPPILTVETQQYVLEEPLTVDKDGTVRIPQKPGLGVELREGLRVRSRRLI